MPLLHIKGIYQSIYITQNLSSPHLPGLPTTYSQCAVTYVWANNMVFVGAIVWAKNFSPISSNVLYVGVLPHPFGNGNFETK